MADTLILEGTTSLELRAKGNGSGVHGLSSSGPGVQAESNSGPGLLCMTIQGLNVIEARRINQTVFVVRQNGSVLADGPFGGPADFAEMLQVDGPVSAYAPGDLLVIGPTGKLTRATEPNATNLAGVYSTDPGFIGDMRLRSRGLAAIDHSAAAIARVGDDDAWVPVALVGVVPVNASSENGAIRPGDLLTTSATPGHAMRAEPARVGGAAVHPTGTVLGKALEPLESGKAQIKVLLMVG